MPSLREISRDAFRALDLSSKPPYLMEDGLPFHVLLAQQFDRDLLDGIGSLATKIRFIAKAKEGMDFLHGLLSHRRAMLYFTQPSTRTFLSFCAACQIVGMRIGEVRDASTSSELKGESKEDSVRTFSSYFDIIVMRSEIGGLAERMAWVLSNSERPVPIINAGSGKDQHPTQALLDIYTLQRSFEARGGIDGKRIVFVGDLARGRTVRSLSVLLTNYEGVEQCFVAPPPLQIQEDIVGILDEKGVKYELSNDFSSQIASADAIYMTRVQDEWDTNSGDSARIDISKYCFRTEYLERLASHAIIMHPLPRRHEIPVEVDHDPRAMYWRQMRNGMWIRTALMVTIFRVQDAVNDYYAKNLRQTDHG